jgi:DHA1 family 2-module integral membrane pump EmrD-like MFS transporter
MFCFSAHSGDYLLIGRLIQGIGAGASMGAIRAVVSDCFAGKRLAFIAAYFGTLVSISPILAPVVGGYLETYFNWRANFVVLGVYALIVFIWACFVKETNQNRHLHRFHWKYHLQNYRTLLTQPLFVIYTFCGGGAVAVSMAYATSAPFIFQKTLGLSPLVFGWMGIFVGGGNILGKLAVPSLIKRYEMKTTLILGLLTILFAGLILALALWVQNIALILVISAVLLSLFGQGLCIANAMALGLSPYRHIGGAANALWTFMQMGLSFLISLFLSGPLFKTNQILGLSSVYVLIGLSLMLLLLLP